MQFKASCVRMQNGWFFLSSNRFKIVQILLAIICLLAWWEQKTNPILVGWKTTCCTDCDSSFLPRRATCTTVVSIPSSSLHASVFCAPSDEASCFRCEYHALLLLSRVLKQMARLISTSNSRELVRRTRYANHYCVVVLEHSFSTPLLKNSVL